MCMGVIGRHSTQTLADEISTCSRQVLGLGGFSLHGIRIFRMPTCVSVLVLDPVALELLIQALLFLQ